MRRAKLRVKTGCSQCRRRKKKCDERRPSCSACERLDAYCLYLDQVTITTQLAERTKSPANQDETDGAIVEAGNTPSSPILKLSPCTGYSKETCAVLEHFIDGYTQEVLTDEAHANNLLSLVPEALKTPMYLAALCSVLALFMPMSWDQRSRLALRLSQQAVRQVSSAIQGTGSMPLPEHVISTTGLLYLHDVRSRTMGRATVIGDSESRERANICRQLHAAPESAREWSHLFGLGAMFEQNLRSPSGRLAVQIESLEYYLYHVIVNSTVDFDFVIGGTTASMIDEFIAYIADRKKMAVSELRVLGVSAQVLSEIFRLSALRREFLRRGNLTEDMWGCTSSAAPDSSLDAGFVPMKLVAFDALYSTACSLLRLALLDAAAAAADSGPRTCQADLDVLCDSPQLRATFAHIRSQQRPCLLSTWPLFTIGLAVQSKTARATIRGAFQRLIDNVQMLSVKGVLNVLENGWKTGQGLSVLMSRDLKGTLMF